jgi:hypothetical protein
MANGVIVANGRRMYYEIHGKGEPLVLLHGSFMTIDLNDGQIIPELTNDVRSRTIRWPTIQPTSSRFGIQSSCAT